MKIFDWLEDTLAHTLLNLAKIQDRISDFQRKVFDKANDLYDGYLEDKLDK